MKLIYIANARIPTEKAHGVQIMKTAEAFAAAGVEVELLLPRRHNALAGVDPFKYYGLNRRFGIQTIFSVDLTFWRFLGHFAFLLERFSFAFASALVLLWRRADVYYFRDLIAARFFLLLVGRSRVSAVEIHSVSKRQRRALCVIGRRAHRLVAISNGVRHALEAIGVPPEKIVVAPDGVDLAVFAALPSRAEARRRLGLPEAKRLVMYAGNLFSWKGVFTLAEAAPDLAPEEAEVVMVGGSPQELKNMAAFVRERKIENVRLIGHRPPTEVPLYLAAADALVLPTSARESIGAQFTSPLKLFEYMASGRPIVASDVPSSREVLNDETAVLVKPDSASSLAAGIERVLRDEQFSAKISKKAQEVVKAFSWERRARFILASFDNHATSQLEN